MIVTWEISSNVFSLFPLQLSFALNHNATLTEVVTERCERVKFNKDVKPQSFLTDFAFERKLFYCFSTLCVVDSTRDLPRAS